MILDKKAIVDEFGASPKDVGSSKVQIAILSKKIKILTKHLQTFKKDNSSRRGLLLMIEKRRKLLKYIKRKNNNQYLDILAKLDLRR